jgi:hypothetical protein
MPNPIKAGVIKLGSRISFNANDTSGGNGEARSIINMLHIGGAEVHIFTKILKTDNLLPEYHWHNLSDFNSAFPGVPDVLVVLNGSVNFFGGAEDREQLLNYRMINEFKGAVFYIYCDPALTLEQVWPAVSKKSWGEKWTEESLNITRKDITYISQPHDVDKVLNALKPRTPENWEQWTRLKNKIDNKVLPAKIIHYPFEKFPCLNSQLPFNQKPEVDLSYGGTMRGGKRVKKMVKFYFGHPPGITVEMFGKIKHEDFADVLDGEREPTYTGPVRYDEILPKMNKATAHCVIGDPYYEKINDMAQRAYEAIWSSVVTFIDYDLDKLRRVYGRDKVLADFLYVKNREELSEKIQLLKSDDQLRRQIIANQIEAIDFDPKEFCTDFVELLK